MLKKYFADRTDLNSIKISIYARRVSLSQKQFSSTSLGSHNLCLTQG